MLLIIYSILSSSSNKSVITSSVIFISLSVPCSSGVTGPTGYTGAPGINGVNSGLILFMDTNSVTGGAAPQDGPLQTDPNLGVQSVS